MIADYAVALAGLTGPSIASVVDAREHRLPTPLLHGSLVAIAAVVATATAVEGDPSRALLAVAIAAAVTAPAAALWAWRPRHIGFGDVRLLTVLGLTIGWLAPRWVIAWLLLGLTITALHAVARRATTTPLGPGLTAAAIIVSVINLASSP